MFSPFFYALYLYSSHSWLNCFLDFFLVVVVVILGMFPTMIVGFFCQFVFILSLIQRGARKWLHVSEVPEAHLTSFSHSKPGFFQFLAAQHGSHWVASWLKMNRLISKAQQKPICWVLVFQILERVSILFYSRRAKWRGDWGWEMVTSAVPFFSICAALWTCHV